MNILVRHPVSRKRKNSLVTIQHTAQSEEASEEHKIANPKYLAHKTRNRQRTLPLTNKERWLQPLVKTLARVR